MEHPTTNSPPPLPEATTLKRSLSLPLITFYGIGTIIGAGIYVLIGEVAGRAGMYAPVAFSLAALIAGFSAFSYAELSARHPRDRKSTRLNSSHPSRSRMPSSA